jgi:hypothetical protein
MDELTDIRFQIAEGITNLDAKIRRQDIALFVLRGALAILLRPDNPEAAERRLEEIEFQFVKAEVQLQDTHELLRLIRNLQSTT